MATRTTGRPPKLTPAIQDALVQAVSAGVSLSTAAQFAHIADATAQEWLQRGLGTHPTRPKTPRYAAFAEAVTRAKAADELRRCARIEQAGRGGAVVSRKTITYPDGRTMTDETYAPPDWRADAWHLERGYPERWGRRQHVDLAVNITAMAAKVAAELGLDTEAVLAEAAQLLRECDANATR